MSAMSVNALVVHCAKATTEITFSIESTITNDLVEIDIWAVLTLLSAVFLYRNQGASERAITSRDTIN